MDGRGEAVEGQGKAAKGQGKAVDGRGEAVEGRGKAAKGRGEAVERFEERRRKGRGKAVERSRKGGGKVEGEAAERGGGKRRCERHLALLLGQRLGCDRNACVNQQALCNQRDDANLSTLPACQLFGCALRQRRTAGKKATQSAPWKRSERQRKESCCFVVSPSASLFASTSAPNFARQAAEMTRGFEYERSMSSHIS